MKPHFRMISSGEGSMSVPLVSLVAILTISLTVNLPGLAISPIEGKLHRVFQGVTDLQVQLLEVLPNVVIIPFILLSGKIATQRRQTGVLVAGLLLYLLAGVACVFADSMEWLIILSCLLGVGCGLIIPLAASMISQHFRRGQRVRFLGMKSGLSNFMVIIGTLFVGWVAAVDWHLSFIVYLVPVIPLLLVPFMTNGFFKRNTAGVTTHTAQAAPMQTPGDGSPVFTGRGKRLKTLAGIILLYVSMTYASIVVSYYIPFTMQKYGFESGAVGVATAMYYLAATCAGFALTPYIRAMGRWSIHFAMVVLAGGLFMTAAVHAEWGYIVAIFLTGLGYGVIQPIVYDKTTAVAPTRQAATKYFSYLLSGNYIGIAIVPFLIDGVSELFGQQGNVNFPYIANGVFVVLYLAVAVLMRRSFVFSETTKG